MPKVSLPNWKDLAVWQDQGYYKLQTEDMGDVPVRLFFTPSLLAEADETLYQQIVNATHFPGVRLVAITPDAHFGYGVPVGSVILTDGTLAMGPVGFDIGCGMLSARSEVAVREATPRKRLEFNQAVMERIEMGLGGGKSPLGKLEKGPFEELIRGGADYYLSHYEVNFDRSRAERNQLPVADDWSVPWGGTGRPERGLEQLGTLGGGNHFIELQQCQETDTLFVQAHTGSRGFGHGLATYYFEAARAANPAIINIDLGYFTPDSPLHREYLNAVAMAANYAILNRLILFEQIARAFKKVFKGELELIYEISHNLVQKEWHPQFGEVWVHRKGATRAFPAGHPALDGTIWQERGHPVLIPGSNKDFSFILRPLPGAEHSGYSVNHGSGRRLSRGTALERLSQEKVDYQYKKAGVVVNDGAHVPLDEASVCYKPSQEVVAAVVGAGLAEIEYRLWPLASLKGTDETRRYRQTIASTGSTPKQRHNYNEGQSRRDRKSKPWKKD